MKLLPSSLCLVSCLFLPLSAKDDAPRGFTPLAELKEAQKALK